MSLRLVDYTNAAHSLSVVQSQEPWANRDEIIRRAEAAENAFARYYGLKPVTVHVQSRFIERDTIGYGIAPRRWPYIVKYPFNVTIFVAVDADLQTFVDGWLYHREILDRAVAMPDDGTHMIDYPFRSMRTFALEKAR